MIDAKLKARIEEALGLRGAKPNHAVRFKDIANLKTDTSEVARIAEKVARDVAETYDGANVDLSQLQDDVDEAMQAAAAAAAAASNAQSAANNAAAYTDQVSQQVRDDLAVDFAAAQQAAQDALAHATEAESWLLATEAGAARLFPSDFRDGARFWKHTRTGAPEDAPDLPPGSELLTEGGVGDFIRLRSDATEDQYVLSRGVAEYEAGRTIRITARVRNLTATTGKLRTAIAILRADYSLRRVVRTSLLEPTTPEEWQTITRDLELPAANSDEVWFRAGVFTTEATTPDETVDVAMIRIEDVTLLKQSEDASADASIARDDAVAAVTDAQTAAAAAQTSQSLAASSAATAATEAGAAEGARLDAENSATAAADSATTASTQATDAGSSAYAAEQSRLAAEAARDGANDASTSAGIARDDAVTARQDAETAAAGAQASLELTAEVSGRDMSVINDTFLISSDWARLNSAGDLTQLPNTVYPIGRDWRFVVTSGQNDGLGIVGSPDTIWTGQTNADAFVVEVIFTLSSGSLGGAGVRVAWVNSGGTKSYTSKTLTEMQAGDGLAGRARTARGVFRRPAGFTGTFASNDLLVYANLNISGWTRQAKTITFHRVSIRPATAEELGSGAVAEGVQANLLVNYLTSAQTQQAIADLEQELTASVGDVSAIVTQHSTAIATLEGNASGLIGFAVQAGNQVSLLQLMAADGTAGSYSIARIAASHILLEGSVSAPMLVIHDPANLIPDNQFQAESAWGLPSVPYSLVNVGGNFDSLGAVYYTRSAAPAGWGGWVTSRDFSVRSNTEYFFQIRVATVGTGGNTNLWSRVRWLDGFNNEISTNSIYIGTRTGNYLETAEITSPAGAQRAEVEFNINRDNTTVDCRVGDIVARAKENAATLIEPDSITSPLIVAEAVKAVHVDAGSFNAAGLAIFQGNLQSDNFNASAGTGWRITQAGSMIMPFAAVKRGNIEDLSVNSLKIAGHSVSVFEHSFTASSVQTAASGWVNVQNMVIDKGRSDPIPIWYRINIGSKVTGTDLGKAVLVRLLRDGTVIDTQSFEIARYADVDETDQTFSFIDIYSGTGTTNYRIQVKAFELSYQNSSGGSDEVWSQAAYNVSRRFIGCFNAFK